jgi:hypothetical protein
MQMARGAVLAAALVASLAGALQFEEVQAGPDARQYPVTRVVNLLKGMQKQMQQEQDTDEEVYEKMACWCETNDKDKTKAITDAEAKLSQLTTTIEKMTALSSALHSEIQGLEKEIERNEKALAQATAIRERQAAEFHTDEKELMQSVKGLEAAVIVLGKHHGEKAAAFLDQASGLALLKTADAQLRRHAELFRGVVTPRQRKVVAALAKTSDKQQPEYQAQSGEVFGILKQMLETFKANLSDSQKEELEAQKAYKELKAAKEEEIKSGKTFLETKEVQLANAEETLANSKQEKEDTQASLTADERFLMDLKSRCALSDSEWTERQKTRSEEMAAVAKAISILAGDQARDTFSSTFNAAAFLQTESSKQSSIRKQAADVLSAVAAKTGNPKMSMLANSVQLDAFTKVKEAIDKMVAQLLQEAKDESAHRDLCIDDLHLNDLDTQKETHAHEGLTIEISGFEIHIKELSSTIEELGAQVADLKTQLKRAGEDREMEHADFKATVTNQQETQALLASAADVLKKIYREEAETVLAQKVKSGKQAPAGQAPPPAPEGFQSYQTNGGGNSVIMLLEQIIADTKAMEAEATHAEEQTQAAYESFVQETNDSVVTKEQAITDRGAEKAQAEQDLVQAKSELDDVNAVLKSLADGLVALHKSCNFFMENFETRTKARDEEVAALREAKAFLSGMIA